MDIHDNLYFGVLSIVIYTIWPTVCMIITNFGLSFLCVPMRICVQAYTSAYVYTLAQFAFFMVLIVMVMVMVLSFLSVFSLINSCLYDWPMINQNVKINGTYQISLTYIVIMYKITTKRTANCIQFVYRKKCFPFYTKTTNL